MYKRLLIFTFCVIGITAILSILPIHGETEIYDSVVRLHVLANSNSDEDQALKLKVRDAILSASDELFGNCATKEEAQAKKEKALRDIEKQKLEAQEDIHREIVDVALLAAQKIVEREIDENDNTRLVEDFIKEVKN